MKITLRINFYVFFSFLISTNYFISLHEHLDKVKFSEKFFFYLITSSMESLSNELNRIT